MLPASHGAHPFARESHQAGSQKASQQIVYSLLTSPAASLVGIWWCHCVAAGGYVSAAHCTCQATSAVQPPSSKPDFTSRAFLDVVGRTVLYWSTNFKYLLNSTVSCTLILRGMDWNFPDGVDAMLQLTGESAYCSGRRNPSGDSTCPVLILWKTSPIVDSLFTSSTPRSRSTLIPTQTCTKTSILIRQCRLACGPETEIKFVWPNLINKLFKGTHVQHTESLPMNTLAPPNSTPLRQLT